MMDDIKNVLLAGIGSAACTYEKASKLVDDMVAKGKLTINEGKELSEELKRTIKDKTDKVAEKVSDVKPLTKEDMTSLLKGMDFATKSDIDEIKERLSKLESKESEN